MNFRLRALYCLGFILLAQAVQAQPRSSLRPPQREYIERPVAQIYNAAFAALARGNYTVAASEFDEVERQHPYSQWARRAMVMAAFTYYLQNEYEQAILTAQRFLGLYPGNAQAPYAYYLIAQSYYEQISDVSRDQSVTDRAQSAMLNLIRRYPNTPYARDAALKIQLTRDHIAGKEMDVGRYYLARTELAAAAKRFGTVVANYQTTSHIAEALHRLTEVYMSLGLDREAQTAAAILGYNFPLSPWYRDSFALLAKHDLVPKKSETSRVNKIWQGE